MSSIETTADEMGTILLRSGFAGLLSYFPDGSGHQIQSLCLDRATHGTASADIMLALDTLKQSITVGAAASERVAITRTTSNNAMYQSTLRNVPNANEGLESALFRIPDIVRGPVKGERSSPGTVPPNSAMRGVLTCEPRDAGPLQNPRSTASTSDIEQRGLPNIALRAGFSQRITVRNCFVEPVEDANGGLLLLLKGQKLRPRIPGHRAV